MWIVIVEFLHKQQKLHTDYAIGTPIHCTLHTELHTLHTANYTLLTALHTAKCKEFTHTHGHGDTMHCAPTLEGLWMCRTFTDKYKLLIVHY
jgi:hypothetical protein